MGTVRVFYEFNRKNFKRIKSYRLSKTNIDSNLVSMNKFLKKKSKSFTNKT